MCTLPAAQDMLRLVRFHSKLDKLTKPGCWLWTSAHRGGTPYFFMQHRAWNVRTIIGRPDPDQWVVPTCNQKLCVSPHHLTLLDRAGLRDHFKKDPTYFGPGSAQSLRTHCPQGHAYNVANTYHPPSRPNERRCRACSAARSRKLRGMHCNSRRLSALYPRRRSPNIAADSLGCSVTELVALLHGLDSEDVEVFERYWGFGGQAPQSCKDITLAMGRWTACWASMRRLKTESKIRLLLDLKEERRA